MYNRYAIEYRMTPKPGSKVHKGFIRAGTHRDAYNQIVRQTHGKPVIILSTEMLDG